MVFYTNSLEVKNTIYIFKKKAIQRHFPIITVYIYASIRLLHYPKWFIIWYMKIVHTQVLCTFPVTRIKSARRQPSATRVSIIRPIMAELAMCVCALSFNKSIRFLITNKKKSIV